MFNKEILGIENKSLLPSAEENDFTFEAGELSSFQADGEVNKLRDLLSQIEGIAAKKREETAFYDRVATELAKALTLITTVRTDIKKGELAQPISQEDIPLRHRAPF